MAENIRFIKLNQTEETSWLLTNHPNAFLLLTLISSRARRQNGHPDGLIIGDALISAADLTPGVSRQNFRTALEKLVEFKYIKIISNGKRFFEREKSTIKVTIKCHLVNLCDTRIYDINSDNGNQQNNQQVTNSQPTGNHKQERRRRDISNDISNKEEAQPAAQLRSKDFLTFNFETWKFEGISDDDIASWKLMYPHIDLQVETLKAIEWLKNNPSKSNKTLWRKFLTGWFARTNDSIENKKAYRAAASGTQKDRRTKDIHGNPVESPHDGRF